ncbi:hypothetical protein EI94DRAFT_1806554 [Lactarius quietus]|nr:hypothetical protein EI94DRAFT_1806554 [Lactarius quietus]
MLPIKHSKHPVVVGKEIHPSVAFYHDVGYGLRRTQSQRRRAFRLPIVYSNSLADFNNWDSMFMERLTGGITMHRPVTAPAVVLALGNDFDFWAIKAAREWPKSRITAHSLLGMQKEKDQMDTLLKLLNLDDRVTYVRGDPARELRLAYPNNTFDMVRLSYCSLNLAETEWYVFLKEVNRVLKPGAVLEVIDEDLLFPGHEPQDAATEPVGSGPGTQQCYPPLKLIDSSSTFNSSIHSVGTTSSRLDSSRNSNHSDASFSSLPDVSDPLDHSKLTRSWHEMLTSRWISASITSVLPFYLTAIFETFRALPALEILMCPCSSLKSSCSKHGSHQQMLDPEPFRHLVQATVKHEPDAHATWLPAGEAPPHFVASNMSMHLARMVAIVSGCKEAIWGAYNKLYGHDPKSAKIRSRSDDERYKTSVHSVREEFERHWLNWECDMRSRIDMRSTIHNRFQWDCPPSLDEADSDRTRWLRNVARTETGRTTPSLSPSQPVQPDVTTSAPAPENPRSTAEADITKYKAAADIVNVAVKKLIELSIEGASILDLCTEGDKLIEAGTGAVYNKSVKGVKVSKGPRLSPFPILDSDHIGRFVHPGLAFPTCVSVNNCVAHFSPLASDPLSAQKLAKGDVVKLHLGAHIDGFAAISAETIVVGATPDSPVTGRRADVLRAAWTAAEVAMRLVRVGNKNWQVTEAVSKVAAAWDCKPVEGMLSCQQTQNVIDGKKRIILNPGEGQKKDFETATFAEGEVYGIDILVSSGEDGKARPEESRTTIYQRDHTVSYQLKMKTARAVFSEVQKKAGPFPFNVRVLEDEKRARMGLQEAVQHSLVKPYEVVYTPSNTFVAAFHFTIALLSGGPALLTHPPVWYKPELVRTEKELEDEELKELTTRKLRENKKSKKKTEAEEK